MAVAVVVDSTADIPRQLREELSITMVPLLVMFGPQQYRDTIDISNDEFYARLQGGGVHPTTSQPSPGDFAEVYEKLARNHDAILSIHLSSKLSGTVSSAEQAAKMVTQVPIRVIDTGSVSLGCGFTAIEAAKMARAGHSLDEIAAAVEAMVPHIVLWAVLDTIKYLERGGRIGKARALLGTLLNVKPMIYIRGEVLPGERVRTHKKAMVRMEELAAAEAPYRHLAVLYSTGEEHAIELADRLGAFHARDQIFVAQLGSVVGVHGGPGLLGVTGIKAV